MKKLFLDDQRSAPDRSWDVVRSYNEFVEYIEKNGVPDVISFDHDLAFEHYPFNETNPDPNVIPYDKYEEKTGYDALKWLIANHYLPLYTNIHTMNPVGRQNMVNLLNDTKRRTKIS